MHITLILSNQTPSGYRPKHNIIQSPIGLLYAASQLRELGYSVSFFDGRLENSNYLLGGAVPPDLIIVASADYDRSQCYSLDISPVRTTVQQIRTRFKCPIFLAGPHGTVAPQETLDFIGPDAVLMGEMDFVIPQAVEQFSSVGRIPPIFPDTKMSVVPTRDMVRNLPLPAYDLAPMHSYYAEAVVPESKEILTLPSGLLIGSRGCPYECTFCYVPFGNNVKWRDPEQVVREIKLQYDDFGIKNFFFLDYTFTLKPTWVREVCSILEAEHLDITWVCQTRCDHLDSEVLKRMRSAGCTGMWLGIESPFQSNLDIIKKAIKTETIERGIENVRAADILPLTFILVGLKYDTASTLEALITWIEQQQIIHSISVLEPRVGTSLFENSQFRSLFDGVGWDYHEQVRRQFGESELTYAQSMPIIERLRDHPLRIGNVRKQLGAQF